MAQLRPSSPLIRIFLLFVLLPHSSLTTAQAIDVADWSALEQQARGQTVYFNAWGGEPRINSYLNWVAQTLEQRFDINLQHVKVADTGETVSKIVAERQAGNDTNGSIDLLWVNGENFAALKQNKLLFGPWAEE